MAKLTVGDIAEARAYERERDDFRRRVIAVKKKRRVSVGPVITLLFENRDTIRFQVQEMARAEKILSDDGIQAELDVYNPLIPERGSLCATLFIELTSEDGMRDWLPKLVGVERSVELHLADGSTVSALPDADHAEQLTRDEITASVHYLRFDLTPEEVEVARTGAISLVLAHPNYRYATELDEMTRHELIGDLTGG